MRQRLHARPDHVALLRANPDAFIGGNINGSRPARCCACRGGNELASVEPQQASADRRRPDRSSGAPRAAPRRSRRRPTRAAAAGVARRTASTTAASRTASPHASPTRGWKSFRPAPATRPRRAHNPASAPEARATMLRQELQQTKETLAAREAEVQELKSRVAELEKLQQQQQQLIAMKDSELAAAQQRLAQTQSRRTAGRCACCPGSIGLVGALAAGAGLLALAVAPPSRPTPRRNSAHRGDVRLPSLCRRHSRRKSGRPSWTTSPSMRLSLAATRRCNAPQPAARATAPAWHDRCGRVQRTSGDLLEPSLSAQPAQERLELARAYLDLGDHASARQLLGEVVDQRRPWRAPAGGPDAARTGVSGCHSPPEETGLPHAASLRAGRRIRRQRIPRLAAPEQARRGRPGGETPSRRRSKRRCRSSPAHPVETVCAGRTDAGVHARLPGRAFRQPRCCATRAAGCWAPPAACRRRSACVVPRRWRTTSTRASRRARAATATASSTAPVRPALRRQYLTWERRPLDADAMHRAAQALLGENDFSAFRTVHCQAPHARRDLQEIVVRRDGDDRRASKCRPTRSCTTWSATSSAAC